MNQEKEFSKIIVIICFALATLFLLFKAKIGFGEVDEPLVLSIPYRMANGDALFKDEWNLSQMTGLIQYPLMKLFLAINGNSTTGIILWFRRAYIAINLICCVGLYRILLKYSQKLALYFAIFMYLFAPANIMQMYYNTIGMLTMLFVTLIFYENKNCMSYCVAGILMAIAALCNPYLVLVYLYYGVLLIICREWKMIPYFIAGGGLIFAIWVVYVFSDINIENFLINLQCMLIGDAGHTGGIIKKPITFFLELLVVNKSTLIAMVGYIILILFRKKITCNIAGVISKLICALHLFFILDYHTINPVYISIPLSAYGFYYIVNNWENNSSVFKWIYLPGALYGLLLHIASDNGLATIAIAGPTTMLATVIAISADDYNYKKKNNINNILKNLICVESIFLLFIWRLIGVYWNEPIWEQREKINYGPEKGLIVAEDRLHTYDRISSEVDKLDSSKKTLFFTSRTWMFLEEGFENCSYSAWIWNISKDTVSRFINYYDINPEKKAEVVYIDYTNAELAEYWEKAGYIIKEYTPSGGVILIQQSSE